MHVGVLAAVAVLALVTAWAAGLQASPPAPGGTDAVRLGPDPGERVADYLARVRDPGPEPGARLGLVQFAAERDADAAVAAVTADEGSRPTEVAQAVYRVPITRVQTAVRRLDLTVVGDGGPGAVADAVRAAQTQAANQARSQARTASGRAGAIAATEARALAPDAAGERCACVLALVVRAHPPAWAAIAARPGVRAVQVAPPEARPEALAVSPLLPEQRDVVGPVPDDGPVSVPTG